MSDETPRRTRPPARPDSGRAKARPVATARPVRNGEKSDRRVNSERRKRPVQKSPNSERRTAQRRKSERMDSEYEYESNAAEQKKKQMMLIGGVIGGVVLLLLILVALSSGQQVVEDTEEVAPTSNAIAGFSDHNEAEQEASRLMAEGNRFKYEMEVAMSEDRMNSAKTNYYKAKEYFSKSRSIFNKLLDRYHGEEYSMLEKKIQNLSQALYELNKSAQFDW